MIRRYFPRVFRYFERGRDTRTVHRRHAYADVQQTIIVIRSKRRLPAAMLAESEGMSPSGARLELHAVSNQDANTIRAAG